MTPISMLARMPPPKAARCAISAPNTATASVPPTCRLELRIPAARPAWSAGMASSSTTVSEGSAKPSPSPAGTSAAASSSRPPDVLASISASMPSALNNSPAQIVTCGPNRAAIFAEVRLALDSRAVMGRNIRPATTADSPSTCWKNRLSTKITP